MNALNTYLAALPEDFEYKYDLCLNELGDRLEAEMEDRIREALKANDDHDTGDTDIEAIAEQYGRRLFCHTERGYNAPPRMTKSHSNLTGITPDHTIRITRSAFSHYHGLDQQYTVDLVSVILIEIYEPSRLIAG